MAKDNDTGFDLIAFYKTDPSLTEEGAKLMIPEDPSGKAYLLVRMLPDEAYERALSALSIINARELDSKDEKISTAADKKIVIQAMAQKILVGWEGLAYPYSVEKAEEMLASPQIRRAVRAFALDVGNFRLKAEEAATKK